MGSVCPCMVWMNINVDTAIGDRKREKERNRNNDSVEIEMKENESRLKTEEIRMLSVRSRECSQMSRSLSLVMDLTSRNLMDELNVLLQDPDGMKYLQRFAKNECFYLDAYFSILELKGVPTDDYRKYLGRKVVQKYFKKGASMMIQINQTQDLERLFFDQDSKIVTSVNAERVIYFFDMALESLRELILFRLFKPFKNSKYFYRYTEHKKNHLERIRLSNFEFFDTLGIGSFGKVIRVRKTSTMQFFALKILVKSSLILRSDFTNEMEIMQSISFPFIIGLDYAFQNTHFIFLGMEVAEGGNMSSIEGGVCFSQFFTFSRKYILE